MTRTLNKLRQEPLNVPTTNARSTPMYAGPTPSRPMTARVTTHQNTGTTTTTSSSNYYYQLPSNTKGPLPAELISRRPTSSFASNILPNGTTSHNRVSTGTGPVILQKSNENPSVRISTPMRAPTKSLDTGLHQLDGFNFDNVTFDDHQGRSRVTKNESNQQTITKTTNNRQSSTSRAPSAESQHRGLPEVSVNPQIQSSVQQNTDQLPYLHEQLSNDMHTNHHHIQVEPTNTLKRLSSPIKSQQIIDVQPNIIVQHQRSTSRLTSESNTLQSTTKDPLNEAYIERDHLRTQTLNVESTHINNGNDSTSTLKQYENQQNKMKNLPNLSTPPPSPSSRELGRAWKKPRYKYSIRTATAALVTRKNSKNHRPPGRLKNYGDDSESETTATENQSKEDGK